MWKQISVVIALLLLGFVCGCSTIQGKKAMPVVTESQLNWLEVAYLPGMGHPPVQLSMMGSGNLRIKRGSSPLVANDFSQDIENVKWGDVRVDQINLPPAEMRTLFQGLVDRGLLRPADKDFLASVGRGVPTARIAGTLGRERVARQAVEPELIGFIRDLLKAFDDNKLAAAPGK
jgi:hypothetical protein